MAFELTPLFSGFHSFCCSTQVFEEADLDEDNKLSFTEFEHVISRAPDFLRYSNINDYKSLKL